MVAQLVAGQRAERSDQGSHRGCDPTLIAIEAMYVYKVIGTEFQSEIHTLLDCEALQTLSWKL